MKKPITLVSAALVAAVCSLSVHADKVYYVEPDGNNPEGMTVDAVYTKIGTAINNVTADEPVTIYLKPGHVFSENNMNTNTNRIDLTIIGENTTINAKIGFNQKLIPSVFPSIITMLNITNIYSFVLGSIQKLCLESTDSNNSGFIKQCPPLQNASSKLPCPNTRRSLRQQGLKQ